jgi:hypothetical protein
MSRKLLLLSIVALLVAGASTAGETPWFDMANCGFCKSLTKHEGLIEHITWEQHPISKGIVSVTTVDPKYLDQYRVAHAEMTELGKKMEKGEMVPMCGSCTALGMCMMKNPSMDYVETSTGDVWVMTSENAELIKELQAWAKKNAEEMAKM